MQTYLDQLTPGTRFRVVGVPDLTATLVRCTPCSATVRVDGGVREIEFEETDGTPRRFHARRATTTTWSPATLVEPIFDSEDDASSQPEEIDMATATKRTTKRTVSKKQAPKTAKKAPASKPAARKAKAATGEAKPKKLSAIDAAAQVLAASKQPMNCKELIEAMAAKKLWTSPGGKTPHQTLYSAILREVANKGKDARFKKAERGKFVANG